MEEIVEERVFGSDGDFLLNDVECVGTEASLSQCAFKVNTVDGFEDCTAVGIRCSEFPLFDSFCMNHSHKMYYYILHVHVHECMYMYVCLHFMMILVYLRNPKYIL